MIRDLTLKDVGPASEMALTFASRLNVFTGDNGLGKTFILDVLWWVLTATWAGERAFPRTEFAPPNRDEDDGHEDLSRDDHWDSSEDVASMSVELETRGDEEHLLGLKWLWRHDRQEWVRPPDSGIGRTNADLEAEFRPASLVLYARIDGTYAVWDSYYIKHGSHTVEDAAIILRNHEVWDGKETVDTQIQGVGGKRTVINGLIADWVNWQQRAISPEFDSLRRALHALASPDEPLVPGDPIRVHLRDRRDIPTLATSYGIVPVTLASAGIRRALTLAYLLVWAWTEHIKAAKQSRRSPTRDVVLLLDEPEMHLHPSWQRVFLPAVLRAIGSIAPNAAVQVFTATHSPLVLASLETMFDSKLDDLFVLERDGTRVRATETRFNKEGNVSNWLASEVLGSVGGRSREGELAIAAAMDYMADRTDEAETKLRALHERLSEVPGSSSRSHPSTGRRPKRLVVRIHNALIDTLPAHDEFWVQWVKTWKDYRGSLK